MSDKLDPALAERMSRRAAVPDPLPAGDLTRGLSGERVDVLLGLRRAADDSVLADLAVRGLQVRSVLGDVLTGSIALDQVETLAASDDVVSIESGGRLSTETPEGTGSADGAPGPATDA